MVILLLSATAGRSQEAAASSELIPNVGITPAAALLVHLFTATAQVSGAALPTPSSQAESPVCFIQVLSLEKFALEKCI